MDYQAICDEIKVLLLERDQWWGSVPENGYESLAQKVHQMESRKFEKLAKNHRDPQRIAMTATTMIIYAACLGVSQLQQTLDRIEIEEIPRDMIVVAALARIKHEVEGRHLDVPDSSQTIVWQALTS